MVYSNKLNEEHFNSKYDLYNQMIFNISYSYLRNVEDAEDIVQDVFLEFFKNIDKFKTLDHERYWLVRVTINKSKNILKQSWKRVVNLDNNCVNKLKSSISDNKYVFYLISKLNDKYKSVIT